MDPEDEEDQDDTDTHERKFDDGERFKSKKKVDVPAEALEESTQELVEAGVIPDTVLAEKVTEAVNEPIPTIPQRAPAVIPNRFPSVTRAPQQVPSRVGRARRPGLRRTRARTSGVIGQEEGALAYTGAKVSNASRIGVTRAYYDELQETGWTQNLEALANSNSASGVRERSGSRRLSSRTLMTAVVLGGAAERLYTQYVAGSMRSGKGKVVSRRGKQTSPRQVGPKPRKALKSKSLREAKATSAQADRILRANTFNETGFEAKKGLTTAVKKFRGGRGGLHAPASRFRGGARDIGLFR